LIAWEGETANLAVWVIAGLTTLGVVLRPLRWNEAIWAVLGAATLVGFSLLPLDQAWAGIRRGTDVYLFLIGMMLLAEVARREGLFDWLAVAALRRARGSAPRLFALVYGVGVVVTVFLSNDATAVVLTPAVYAAARAARAEPLPYLLACAFVANAASFVLPISNPANLVVYAAHMPPLGEWLRRFGPASVLAIGVTYAVLRWSQRRSLRAPVANEVAAEPLPVGGRIAAAGIATTAIVLTAVSAMGGGLGLPTMLAGAGTAALTLPLGQGRLRALSGGIAWGVLPLVAGLFVVVQALESTGLLGLLAATLQSATLIDPGRTAWIAGVGVAIGTNLVNNLPAGLLAGAAVEAAQLPAGVASAILVGVDLGPNLSVTGSLATILWLVAIRREGQDVSTWAFLRVGALVMPPALIAALLGLAA